MGDPENNPEARVALFQSREIRRALHNGDWWFVITDTAAALTYAANPADYWKKMRRRDPDVSLDSQGRGQIDPLALAFDTAGGRQNERSGEFLGARYAPNETTGIRGQIYVLRSGL
jgi:prophage antirepressor-like protein